ncbi:Hypothetical predicted protein [Mytilus galloprovincialis]|uniref:B box-type domain-containing protein n=1 Tax=Mytilus galloprovincialis TaxID=29158 RepID=A0A8B6FBY1_MYTGA|nr:Hypothetical predicted protein [Mytilus galloprovincialis]
MDTESKRFCGICEVRQIILEANVWCSECGEGLCSECLEHHKISRSSKHHVAIPIKNYNKLPSSMAGIVNFCDKHHGRKYENYCPSHEQLCCPECISVDHKKCNGILLLQDVIKTAKTSALLDSIETNIKNIKSNIENIKEDRKQNLTIIHNQRQTFQEEINQVRTKVYSHLATLEQNIMKNMDATEAKIKRETDTLTAELSDKVKVADELEKNVLAIREYATDLQIAIPVSMVRSWFINSFVLEGIIVLNNDKMILADSYYRRLLVVNNNNNVDMSIDCKIAGYGPYGVTHVEKALVAVSTSRGIQIVNIETGTVVEKIPTTGECRGIAYNNGALICSVRSIGIQSIQLSNKNTESSITTLIKVEDRHDRLGITVHRNKIYATDFSKHAVSCYTLQGTNLWQFKNESILKCPIGIAVDNNSKVYIAAYKCVICLSFDGKNDKTFAASKDGFSDPTALHFDETRNNLIVANRGQPVFVYHVHDKLM